MSVTAPDKRITTYNPVVPTSDFAALFPIFDNSDIAVYVNDEERTDFTVSASYVEGISNDVVVTTPIGVTGKVQIVGAREPRRTSRFTNGAPLPAWSLNLALDTLQAEMQEARRDIGRAILSPVGSNGLRIDENAVPGEFLALGPDDTIISIDPPDGAGNMNTAVYERLITYTVTNRAELKTLDTTKRRAAFLREAGREGFFSWKAGDYSAQIALDTREGVYVKADLVSSTSGAWVRQFSGSSNPEWFKNALDVDDTASIQAALDVTNNVRLKDEKIYTISPNADFPGVTGTYSSGHVCLNLRPNAKISGFGTLKLASGSVAASGAMIGNPLNPSSSDGIVLRDFSVDGNKANVTGMFAGINLVNSVGPIIENLKVHDVSFLGIGIRTELVLDIDGVPPNNTVAPVRFGALHATIRGNRVWNAANIGIQMACPNGLIITQNHIYDCGDNGIDVYGNDPAASFNFGQDVIISENVIQNTLNGICVESFFKWILSANMISGSKETAVWVNSINTKGSYGTIVGNFFYRGGGTGVNALRFQSGAGRCIVSGNYFHGFDNAFDVNTGAVGIRIGDNHYASIGKYILNVPASVGAAGQVLISGVQYVEANGVDGSGYPQLHSPSDGQVTTRYVQFQALGELYTFLGLVPKNFVKPASWSIVVNGGWGPANALYNGGGDGKTRVQFSGGGPSIGNYLRPSSGIFRVSGDAGSSALYVQKWNGSAFVDGNFVSDFASLTGPSNAPEKYAAWWTQ